MQERKRKVGGADIKDMTEAITTFSWRGGEAGTNKARAAVSMSHQGAEYKPVEKEDRTSYEESGGGDAGRHQGFFQLLEPEKRKPAGGGTGNSTLDHRGQAAGFFLWWRVRMTKEMKKRKIKK